MQRLKQPFFSELYTVVLCKYTNNFVIFLFRLYPYYINFRYTHTRHFRISYILTQKRGQAIGSTSLSIDHLYLSTDNLCSLYCTVCINCLNDIHTVEGCCRNFTICAVICYRYDLTLCIVNNIIADRCFVCKDELPS